MAADVSILIPTKSFSAAIWSAVRLEVPRINRSAVTPASPCFPSGSSMLPAFKLPCTATVGLLRFSWMMITIPLSSTTRVGLIACIRSGDFAPSATAVLIGDGSRLTAGCRPPTANC